MFRSCSLRWSVFCSAPYPLRKDGLYAKATDVPSMPMPLSRGCSLYKCAALCYTIHSIAMLYAEVSLMTNNPQKIVAKYGADILLSEGMRTEKHFIQHGSVSVYDHSLAVAVCAVQIALWSTHIFPWSHKLRLRSLVRGALLHDYFLYDWHVPAKWHRLHGFPHAARACRNPGNAPPLTMPSQNAASGVCPIRRSLFRGRIPAIHSVFVLPVSAICAFRHRRRWGQVLLRKRICQAVQTGR